MNTTYLFSISLALYPILNIYAITGLPGLSLGQFMLVLLIGLKALRNGVISFSYFKSFAIYSLIVTILGITIRNYDWVDSLYEAFALLLFLVIFNNSTVDADYSKVKKWVVYVGLFAFVFFIVQYILFLSGHPISGIVSFLPLSNAVDTETFRLAQMGRDRLSSIFQEPAHFSEFMSIVLAFILFEEKKRTNRILLAIAISISIILSMSTSGAVFLALVWGAWGIRSVNHFKRGKYMIAIIAILLISILIPWVSSSSYAGYISSRFSEITFDPTASEHGFSSYIRVLRGYIPFMESDWIEKIFGHGLGTLRSYIKQNPSTEFLNVTTFNETWVNSFQYLLFMTGIVGTLLFGKQLFYFFIGSSFLGKLFIIQYISAFLSSGILLTPTSALFLYFIEKEKHLNSADL